MKNNIILGSIVIIAIFMAFFLANIIMTPKKNYCPIAKEFFYLDAVDVINGFYVETSGHIVGHLGYDRNEHQCVYKTYQVQLLTGHLVTIFAIDMEKSNE
jgi:hypothetical protein